MKFRLFKGIIALGGVSALLFACNQLLLNHENDHRQQISSRNLLEVTYDRKYPTRGDQGFQTDQTYLQNIALTGLVGAILATFFCIAGIITCCAKACCGRANKRLKSEARCSGNKSIVIIRVLLWVCCAIIIGATIVGLVGNQRLSKGTRSFMNDAVNTAEDLQAKESNIVNKLYQLDPKYDYRDISNEVEKVVTTLKNTEKLVYKIDSVRLSLIFFGLYFALSTAAVGFVAGLLTKNRLALATFVMGFFALFIMWWSFGVHLPISILLDDLCVSVQQYIESNRDESGFLGYFIRCLDTGEYTNTLDSTFTIAQQVLNQLNDTTTQAVGYSFDPSIPSNGTVEERMSALLTKANTIISVVSTVAAAAPSDQKGAIEAQLAKVQLMIDITQDLLDLIQCKNVKAFVLKMKESLCESMLGGIMMIMAANYIIGLTAIPLTFLAVFALRRFDLTLGHYHREKLLLQSMVLVQFILGFVAIATVGVGYGAAMYIGIFIIAIPVVGFIGSYFMKKIITIIFFILECILAVAMLVVIGVISTKLNETSQQADMLSYTIDLIIICLLIVPVLVAIAAALLFIKNFDEISDVTSRERVPSRENPPKEWEAQIGI